MFKIGLLGEKLSHSYSKIIHEIIFSHENINSEYKLYECPKENVESFQEYMKKNDIKGVNITMPYKLFFMDKLDEISEQAKQLGSINLMYFHEDKIYGDNTDYYGFLQTLIKNNIDVTNKSVSIIGNGGAAKAVKGVLKNLNAKEIHSYFRKDKKSKIEFIVKGDAPKGDILINTTPIGMYPDVNSCPIDKKFIKNFNVVIDLIYNPLETELLKEAKLNSIKAVNGIEMLIYQAMKTDEILFNKKFGDELFECIKNHLNYRINKGV